MKKNMYLLLAGALMASCMQNEIPDANKENAPVEVKLFSSAVSADVSTRGTITGIAFPENTLAQVLVTDRAGVYAAATDKMFADGEMTFGVNSATTAVGFTTPQYYPTKAGEETVYLVGLYPKGWSIDAGTKVSFTFSSAQDLMFAKEVSSTKTQAQAGTYPSLAFKHLLTNLIVKAKKESADADIATAIDEKWGKIKSIKLTSTTHSKVEIGVAAEAATATYSEPFVGGVTINHQASGKEKPYTCGDVAFTEIAIPAYQASNDNLDAVAYALTSPLAGTLTFEIETEKGGKVASNVTLTGTGNANQGKYCVVTFTFKVNGVNAKAGIIDWVDGEKVDASEIG